jgi:hypothetical protein
MARQGIGVQLMTIFTVAILVASCANATTQMPPASWPRSGASVLPIPADVQQMAVLYPRGGAADWSNAYGRLEGGIPA